MEPGFPARRLMQRVVVSNCKGGREFHVSELHFIEGIALPSNKSMELTIKSVTPFAYAKAAPLLLAAHARCYAHMRWMANAAGSGRYCIKLFIHHGGRHE